MSTNNNTPKGIGWNAVMFTIIIAVFIIAIVFFVTRESEDSVQPSLQLEVVPDNNITSSVTGPLKIEKPPTMNKVWGEGKVPDKDSNKLQNIYDQMSSINY